MPSSSRDRDAIIANMFPAAVAAIEDWDKFKWHRFAHSPRSSQMLAIDVFGTLKVCPQASRDAILAEIAGRSGVRSDGPWQIQLEWQDSSNRLREIALTQVDAVAISPHAMLLFECKFTEAGGGCSQVKADDLGRIACNGSYTPQTNPQNGLINRCSLSGKGIDYWTWAHKLYGIDPHGDHTPCPFSFDAFQWMRNSTLAAAIQEQEGRETRVLAVYADAPHLKTAYKIRNGRLGLEPLHARDEILPVSFQDIIKLAAVADSNTVWAELLQWVEAKIDASKPRVSSQPKSTTRSSETMQSQLLLHAVWSDAPEQHLLDALASVHDNQAKLFDLVPEAPFVFEDVHLQIGQGFVLFLAEEHWSPGDLCGYIKHRRLIPDGTSVMAVVVDVNAYYLPHHGLADEFQDRLAKIRLFREHHQLARR